MANMQKVILGATLGTLIGSLSIALYPKRKQIIDTLRDHSDYISEKTRAAADYLIDEAQHLRGEDEVELPQNSFWTGSALGLIAGAGAALLLAPKSGKSLRAQIVKAYGDISDRTHDVIGAINESSLHARSKLRTARTNIRKAASNIQSKVNTLQKNAIHAAPKKVRTAVKPAKKGR